MKKENDMDVPFEMPLHLLDSNSSLDKLGCHTNKQRPHTLPYSATIVKDQSLKITRRREEKVLRECGWLTNRRRTSVTEL